MERDGFGDGRDEQVLVRCIDVADLKLTDVCVRLHGDEIAERSIDSTDRSFWEAGRSFPVRVTNHPEKK